jgi:hypothetical protein
MAHVTQAIPDEMLGAHPTPDGADESYQESWGFAWHDPIRRAGGIHHLSYQRVRGIADVLSWIVYDGRRVGYARHFNAAVPTRDFPDWAAAGISVQTDGARNFQVQAATHRGGADAELAFSAYTEPLLFPLDAEGATWGADHYELIGSVDGNVNVAGEQLPVSGYGWQDHSWGPRNMGHLLSHRWVLAIFGPDLFFSVLGILTDASPDPRLMGFIYDDGALSAPTAVTFGARMADDGHSPVGCDAYIWSDAGRGYHITGAVQASVAHAQRPNFWCVDGLTPHECGGRVGGGIFETQELRGPAPWLYEGLGLDSSGAVPIPAASALR